MGAGAVSIGGRGSPLGCPRRGMLKVQAVTLRSKRTGDLGLHYAVYRMDVVRIVSKYIGETKKNLEPA